MKAPSVAGLKSQVTHPKAKRGLATCDVGLGGVFGTFAYGPSAFASGCGGQVSELGDA